MRTQAFVRAAAAALSAALLSGGALAQQQPATRIDTAPPPAEERNSVGSVELVNEPVLAKRRYLEQLARSGAPDTRSMGAGPSRVLRRLQADDDMRLQRALDEARDRSHTPTAP
jgi:hypothetical protein